jgi:hypothetical protein
MSFAVWTWLFRQQHSTSTCPLRSSRQHEASTSLCELVSTEATTRDWMPRRREALQTISHLQGLAQDLVPLSRPDTLHALTSGRVPASAALPNESSACASICYHRDPPPEPLFLRLLSQLASTLFRMRMCLYRAIPNHQFSLLPAQLPPQPFDSAFIPTTRQRSSSEQSLLPPTRTAASAPFRQRICLPSDAEAAYLRSAPVSGLDTCRSEPALPAQAHELSDAVSSP